MVIEDMKHDFDKNTKPERETAQRDTFENSEMRNRSKSNTKETKPSGDWRKGDKVVFNKKKSEKSEKVRDIETSSLNSDIYPKWWGNKMPYPTKEALDKQYNDTTDQKMAERKKQEKRSNADREVGKFANEYGDVQSKIKDQVARDKKMYQIMNPSAKSKNNRFHQKDYNHPRNKNRNENVKTVIVPDYRIEYDRNLKPQAIREKSIERVVRKPQQTKPQPQAKVEVKPKLSYDSDNNVMNDTEGGLSSYAPSERTKNFFVNQFRENSMDKSSALSNSLNYSEEEHHKKYTKKEKAAYNNYMSQK